MKIINYFYKKFFQSFMICIFSIALIFFIFSLIGNLGEKLSFEKILFLSLLNSIQIISYVPSIILLLTIILFVINLRIKKELMIIKGYISINKLVIIFIPIVFCFALIEINKNKLSKSIENIKFNLLKSDYYLSSKVIIYKNDDYKSYLILNDIDVLNPKNVGEYQRYEIENDKIISGEYSNKINLKNNSLVTHNYIKFEEDKIKKIEGDKIILQNINKITNNEFIINDEFKNSIYNLKADQLIKVFYFIIFYECLFLILFNKKIIDIKQRLFFPLLSCTLLLFYSLIIYNVNLKFYYQEQQLLALLLILFIFYKFYRYE